MYKKILFAYLAAILGALFPVHLVAQSSQPNIILIIGDDHGWPDFGFMSSDRTLETNAGPQALNEVVQTPTLDALAAGGVVFRNTHVTASRCVPSLRTLLTAAGLQPLQWQEKRAVLDADPQISLPQNIFQFPRLEVEHFRTVPRELGHARYLSWQGGKMRESTYTRAGFTHGLAEDDGTFYAEDGWDFGRAGWDPALCGPTGDPFIPCPALDPLREFLDEAQGQPFFLWFAPQIPHTPFDAPQNFRDPYEALGLSTCADLGCEESCSSCATEVNYLSNVSWFDSVVAELLQELDDRNLRGETLLIYLSDNGWGLNFQLSAGTGKGKNTLYELGFRTPLIFNWPGNVPAGVVYDDLISSSDVAPTILDYAAVDTLPEQEGQSLRTRINGGEGPGRTEVIGYDETLGHFLRTDTWRYLRFASDGHEELYQIDIDPFESNDVAAENPELLAQFSAQVDTWELARRTAPERVEITGRMLDSGSGEPLVGSQLVLENGPFPLVSIVGEDGWFRFGPVEPGEYVINRGARTRDLNWLGLQDSVPVSVPVAATGAYLNLTATQNIALPGEIGSQIRGTLTDSTGTPMAGVPIVVQGMMGCNAIETRVTTQPDGRFRTENLAFTTYTLTALTPAGMQDVVVEDIVIDSLEPVLQDLVSYPE